MKKSIVLTVALMALHQANAFDPVDAGAGTAASATYTTALPLSPFLGTTAILNGDYKQMLFAAKDDALQFATSESDSVEKSEILKAAIEIVQQTLKAEKNLEVDEKTAAAIIVAVTTPEISNEEKK